MKSSEGGGGNGESPPRYQAYDFARQTTISCDFVRRIMALNFPQKETCLRFELVIPIFDL
jgi:hypothetical protein